MDLPGASEGPRESYYASRYAARAEADAHAKLQRERYAKDAKFFALIGSGFLFAGSILSIVCKHVTYTGPGMSPTEVMSVFMYSAGCVLVFWAVWKYAHS